MTSQQRDKGASPNDSDRAAEVVPVVEEQVLIGRRVVNAAAVRLRKRVSEDQVNVSEPLVREYVETARIPVNRVVTGPVAIREEGDVLVVPVVEERLVVRKELVLVEELRITRRRQAQQVDQQVSLRRESVVVERLDADTQQWSLADEADGLESNPCKAGTDT